MHFEIDDAIVERLSKSDSAKGKLQRVALALLHEHKANGEIPTNSRFLFYELEGRGVVSKKQTGKRQVGQNLSEALMHLREAGIVPWAWIADETRTLHEWDYADSVAEFVADLVEHARINPWPAQPPLLLVESRSLGGVLRNLAYTYLCPLAATNGQAGGFLRTEIVPVLEGNDRAVLYLGDLDHQGSQIEENTRRVLEREIGRTLDWERIAITVGQVAERRLTPIVKKDVRYRPPLEMEAWECEALGQGTVTALVREALDRLIPEPIADVRVREEGERVAVRMLLQGSNGR